MLDCRGRNFLFPYIYLFLEAILKTIPKFIGMIVIIFLCCLFSGCHAGLKSINFSTNLVKASDVSLRLPKHLHKINPK